MNAFWAVVASNAVVATILAAGALLLGRTWKNAAAVHVLWVVVLLKLFTPPLVTAELPPAFFNSPTPAAGAWPLEEAPGRASPVEAGRSAPVGSTSPRDAPAGGDLRQSPGVRTSGPLGHRPWSLPAILGAIWACGSCGSAAVQAVRIRRFARGLRESEAASPSVRAMVAQLSGRLGLRRDPEVLMTSRALPPLVWSMGTRPRVILPSRLFDRLGVEARRTILAHELAHIRRGDDLVRLLELAAATVFWWHPVVWLAARQLRELEEQCCDGRVLELLPQWPRTYAVALIDTLEFLAGRGCDPAPLRTAIDPTHSLTRRIHMLTQRRAYRLSALSATLVAGLAGLPLALAFAVGPEQAGRAAPAAGGQQPVGAPVAALRGRVTSKAGVPLPGVRVRVAVPAIDMRFVDSNPDHLVLETKSDAKGDYRIELPQVAKRTTISIDAMMPSYRRLVGTLMAGGDARRVDVEPGAAPAVADLALDPARYYRGLVVDEQGRPIPSAEVGAYSVIGQGTGGVEMTRTGADGSFEIFNYPAEPRAFGGEAEKGFVSFSHPDYVEYRLEDIDEVEPNRRGDLRIVLPTGRKVSGTVLDLDGKPVSKAMVEAVLDPGTQRKATLTDAEGRFALRGLVGGPTTLTARSLEIKQKARLPIALDADKEGLEVRLRSNALPADLKTHSVLGMRLTDVTPALKSAYDLWQDHGALILDPGPDSDRLKVGDLVEGYAFWMAGHTRVGNVREFVDQLLVETGGLDAEVYSVRVVYSFKTTEFTGTNTQYMKLTKDDVKQLQAISDRLKAEAK